jgi:hypothetical protein
MWAVALPHQTIGSSWCAVSGVHNWLLQCAVPDNTRKRQASLNPVALQDLMFVAVAVADQLRAAGCTFSTLCVCVLCVVRHAACCVLPVAR